MVFQADDQRSYFRVLLVVLVRPRDVLRNEEDVRDAGVETPRKLTNSALDAIEHVRRGVALRCLRLQKVGIDWHAPLVERRDARGNPVGTRHQSCTGIFLATHASMIVAASANVTPSAGTKSSAQEFFGISKGIPLTPIPTTLR